MTRLTAVLKSNLIRSIEFGTAVARRLKRTSFERVKRKELKYNVKGVCLGQIIPHSSNRISRSISIKALPYCKLYNASTIIGIILQLRGTTVGVF